MKTIAKHWIDEKDEMDTLTWSNMINVLLLWFDFWFLFCLFDCSLIVRTKASPFFFFFICLLTKLYNIWSYRSLSIVACTHTTVSPLLLRFDLLIWQHVFFHFCSSRFSNHLFLYLLLFLFLGLTCCWDTGISLKFLMMIVSFIYRLLVSVQY